MLKSWRLGRIFGFPVEINLSFLLLLAVVFFAFGGLAGLLIVGLTFGSVVLHELGHALVARRYGVHVSGIELSFFGGAAKMADMPRAASHEIAIAAAGPAVSLMLGGLGFGLGALLHSSLFWAIGGINFVLAAFNLIPALPMDGGRILRAVLSRRMDFVRATEISVTVSRVFAVSFAVFGLFAQWYQLVLLAPLLWIMGTREQTMARTLRHQFVGYGQGGTRPFDQWGHPGPGAEPFGRAGFGTGGWRGDDGADLGAAPRRFMVRQVGGRLVIETID